MRPLVFSVEDDLNIQNVIKIALENSQFEIVNFDNAKSLFQRLNEQIPDLFLLDIMLPDIDGLEIIRRIRNNSKYKRIPIMVVSAKTSEIDRVIGIDLGADDYLIKPFGVLELVSRCKALLRRFDDTDAKKIIEIKGLLLDASNYNVNYRSNTLIFTKKQFELLKYFMENHNKVLTRDDILNKVWGYDFLGETRTLDVHVKEIRKKLKESGLEGNLIETLRGVGYKFVL
jgi:two-component system alkaline phosphatase synthesis response regulator PhoP